jgi:uncharacterized protein YecT (DUF1311 family)
MIDHRQTSAWNRPMMRVAIATLAMSLSTSAPAANSARDGTVLTLDRCLAVPANASTAGQTDCEAAALQGYDQRMNVAYAALLRQLPAPVGDRLRRSQRAWLAYRDVEGITRDALYATRQGTMYVPMQADDAVVLVGDRARLLERYVRALEIE